MAKKNDSLWAKLKRLIIGTPKNKEERDDNTNPFERKKKGGEKKPPNYFLFWEKKAGAHQLHAKGLQFVVDNVPKFFWDDESVSMEVGRLWPKLDPDGITSKITELWNAGLISEGTFHVDVATGIIVGVVDETLAKGLEQELKNLPKSRSLPREEDILEVTLNGMSSDDCRRELLAIFTGVQANEQAFMQRLKQITSWEDELREIAVACAKATRCDWVQKFEDERQRTGSENPPAPVPSTPEPTPVDPRSDPAGQPRTDPYRFA